MRYAAGEARDWVRATLSGCLTILYTPFDAEGAVEEDGLHHTVRETLARHAQEARADLVMVWPPHDGPRSAAGVCAFYEHAAGRIGIGMVVHAATLAELGYSLDPEQVAGLLPPPTVCAVQDTTLNFASHARMMERVGDRLAVATALAAHVLFGRLTYPDRAPRVMIGSSRPALSPPDARDMDECVAVLREAGLLDATAGR